MAVVLDGGARPVEGGRYSMEAFDPWLIFRASESGVELRSRDEVRLRDENPFDLLRELIDAHTAVRREGLPPFPEVAGYIGYGATCWTLPVDRLKGDPLHLPDMALGFFDLFLVRDALERTTWLVSTGLPEKGSAAAARAKERLDRLRGMIESLGVDEGARVAPAATTWSPALPDSYRRSLRRVHEAIREGEIYQANITRLFRMECRRDPWDLYTDLARSNPASYAGMIRCADFSLISSSPELFLRVDGDRVESSPIKGTRPRSEDRAVDRRLGEELFASEKDRAEHLMIVDLVRNDLGKNCRFGSIEVDQIFRILSCPSVHHMESTVRGVLSEGKSFVDVFEGIFPGGSITGAPKKRAVEIIDDEEEEGRGPFYGAMGYVSFDRRAVWNLLIRSAVVREGEVAFRVGGGIVADSDVEGEWRELAWKGSKLFEVFQGRPVAAACGVVGAGGRS